jgi:hypothetical protein
MLKISPANALPTPDIPSLHGDPVPGADKVNKMMKHH